MLPPNVEGHKNEEDWKSKYSLYANTEPPVAADGSEALADPAEMNQSFLILHLLP